MPSQNPAHMSATDILAEIHRVKAEINAGALRLSFLSQALYQNARRGGQRREYEQATVAISDLESRIRKTAEDQRPPLVDALGRLRTEQQDHQQRVAAYTAVANAWTRFAGMIVQGLRRNHNVDRMVEKYRQVPVESPPPAGPPKPTPAEVQAVPDLNELVELYGVEAVTHARG